MRDKIRFDFENILPFWNNLTGDEKNLIRYNAHTVHYEKDNVIYSGEKNCLGFMVVLSGKINVSLLSEDGREITLFTISDNSPCILTASCILQQITFDTQITADTDTDAVIIPSAIYQHIKDSNIYVECFTYKLTTERFSDVMWAMQQLLFFAFDRRLAIYLYDESLHSGSDTIKTTHEQIARHIGSAREVVSRMLKQFSEEGIVSLGRGYVKILKPEALKEKL